MTGETALRALAEWAAQVGPDSLPTSTQQVGSLLLADTVGAALRGSRQSEVAQLAARLHGRHGDGRHVVLSPSFPRSSAMVSTVHNSASATWFELDPGHQRHRTHAAAHVLPAVLAVADDETTTHELLSAFVVGVEVAYRVGAAVELAETTHSHGLWGAIGAAAAVAHLQQADERTTARALSLAAQLMLATSSRSVRTGATVRNALPGVAAQNAVLAVDLAHCGFTPLADPITDILGDVLRSQLRPELMTDGLGTTHEVEASYFKFHSCCHHLAAAVDAALDCATQIRAEGTHRSIERVRVETYDRAARFTNSRPAVPLAAMFSIEYVVWTALSTGRVGPDEMAGCVVRSVEPDDLDRVSVGVSRVAEDAYPGRRSATVTVELSGGRRVTATCGTPRGTQWSTGRALALEGKFLSLVDGIPSVDGPRLWSRLQTPSATDRLPMLFGLGRAPTALR